MKRNLYSYNQKNSKNKLFFQQLKNSWNIDQVDAEKYLKENKIELKQYSEKHFETIYKLVNEKISNMKTEEKVLYIEYRKIRLDNSRYKDVLKYIIAFFIGSSFSSFTNFFENSSIYNNIAILISGLAIVALYLYMTISPKDEFDSQLVTALEKNINKN